FVKDVRVYFRYPSLILSEFITLPAWFVLFAVGVAANFVPKGTVTNTLGAASAFSFFYWGFVFLIIFSTSIWGVGQYIRTEQLQGDRKSTRLNSSHGSISYAVFCLKKKKNI